jgi:AcrR family transcriptional regulator
MSLAVITSPYLMTFTDINYHLPMGRWAPGAAGRLRDAAVDLFAAEGFQNVTVEQIAEAAGVTGRTFFRHFPTKQDVLFGEGDEVLARLLAAIRQAPASSTPRQLVLAAVCQLAIMMEPDRSHLRQRAAIIDSVTVLHERELLKRHQIAMSLVDELVERGIERRQAVALAGVGMVVFQTAYRAWTTDRSRTALAVRIERILDEVVSGLAG